MNPKAIAVAVQVLALALGSIFCVEAATVRVAVCQLSAASGDLNANLAKMDSYAQQASAAGAQIVVFPEWMDLGGNFPQGGYTGPAVQPVPGTTSAALGVIAAKYNLWVAVAIWEGVPGGAYDTFVLLNNRGELVVKSRKQFVGGRFNAGPAFNGNFHDAQTAPSPWGPIGGMICADMGDAGKHRIFAAQQPGLMICVFSNPPANLLAHCNTLATDCGCPVVGVNMAWPGGTQGGNGGKSLFASAAGATLWQAGTGVEILKTWDLTVNPPVNRKPCVDPGDTQTIRLAVNAVNLKGYATDDGLPGGALTTTWSKVSGPGTVTFGNASALATTATFSASGVYVLRLTASDGSLSSSLDLSITVLPASGDLNLAGHWKFESNALDSSGLGNNGTLNGTSLYSTDVPPGIGSTRSLDLASQSGYVQVPHSANLNATNAATITAWVKPRVSFPGFVGNGGNNWTALLNKGLTWGNHNYSLAQGAYFYFYGQGMGVTRNGSLDKTILIPGAWYHLAAVLDFNRKQGKLYFNGVLDHMWLSNGATVMTNSDALIIGAFTSTGTRFDGKIDDVRLYTRALSDVEIAALVPGATVNQTPTINAGSDQTITLPAGATLSGTYGDDGHPVTAASATWTYWRTLRGPAEVSFGNRFALSTSANFTQSGTYVLELQGSDGTHRVADTVQVTVNSGAPVNQGPNVNAGPDQSITLPAAASLDGTLSDDGLPNPPGTVTSTWSKVSGPGTVTFGNANTVDTTAAFSVSGSYVLRLTASDSVLSSTDDVVLTVNPQPSTGPLAHWRLDEAAGLTAVDSSGNGHTGTLVNGPLWTAGKVGGALDFDGANDCVNCGSSNALNVTGDLTIAAWVWHDTQAGADTIVMKGGAYNNNSPWNFGLAGGGGIRFSHNNGSSGQDELISTSPVPLASWRHLAGTRDAAGMVRRIYIDGVLVTGPTAYSRPPTANTQAVSLGGQTAAPADSPFDGKLDDVRIYNRVLSAAEISALAASGPPNQAPTANAGSDQAVSPGTASLSGSGSDPDNGPSPLTYAWTQVSGPAAVTIQNANQASANAALSALGTYVFRLTVNDGAASVSDDVSISVVDSAPPDVDVPTITLKGAVDGTGSPIVSVTVNGQPAAVSGNVWSKDVTVNSGSNAYNVTATDSGGQQANTSVQVTK